MGRYNFVSPAGNTDAIMEQLLLRERLRQETKAREQAMLDRTEDRRLREAQINATIANQQGVAADRAQAAKDRETERRFRRAATVATVGLPGQTDEDTAKLLEDEGFGSLIKRTPAGRSFVAQEPSTGEDIWQDTPGVIDFLGGTQYQAREDTQAARREAAQAAADARSQLERERIEAANERARQDRMATADRTAFSQMIAQQGLDLRRDAESRQQAADDAKAAEKEAEKKKAADAVARERQSLRSLALEIANDPQLPSITGAIQGRRDTFWQGANTQLLSKYNQLQSMLALQGREKLKGSGAVSNYEAQGVAQAMSALNRASGTDLTRDLLLDIADQFEGDAPSDRPRPSRRSQQLQQQSVPGIVAPGGSRFSVIERK